ncbi:MAG: ABC transporter permease [Firmicutes bacterium HGW-Firmicutes-9]|jgi:simple sugar transport system permease protein|nr:MAG: ABC transporter permease [Firmicutes bacterium HGW-Firmicutes-9]
MIGKKLSRIAKTNEFFVLLVILVVFFTVSAISPVFLSAYSLVSVIKTAIEPIIYAVGAYLVILSGGIDLTVAGIGAFSMFTATKIVFSMNYEGSALLPYLLAIGFGAALGMINGLLISRLKIQPMIATLGMNSIINGVMLFFIGSREISQVPIGIQTAGKTYVMTVYNANGVAAPLSTTIYITIAVVFVVYLLLRYTMLGANIFAIGGNVESAMRAGIDVKKTQFIVYVLAGMLYGLGGMVHTITYVNSNPMDLLGQEMITIAAVIIGGARITGGHGTLTGTVLGVLLIQLIDNCLNTVGIPSFWQRLVVGLVLLVGTSLTSYQALKEKRRLHVEISSAPISMQ